MPENKTSITVRISEETDLRLRHWAVDQKLQIGEAIDRIVSIFFDTIVNRELQKKER